METLLAIIVLLSLPCYLGFRHMLEYYDAPFSKDNFGIGAALATVLLVLYIISFFYLRIDELYDLSEGRKRDKFAIFFIEPTIGFGIAIFNKVAAEYMFNFNTLSSIKFLKEICTFVGWLLIIRLIGVFIL